MVGVQISGLTGVLTALACFLSISLWVEQLPFSFSNFRFRVLALRSGVSFLAGTCCRNWLSPRSGLLLTLPLVFVWLVLRIAMAAATAVVTAAWNVVESV